MRDDRLPPIDLAVLLKLRVYRYFERWKTLERQGLCCISDVGEDGRGQYYIVLIYDAKLSADLSTAMEGHDGSTP